jgi:hypothetical protein
MKSSRTTQLHWYFAHMVKKLSAFYRTQRSTAMFKTAQHWSLFWATQIQHTLFSFHSRFNIIVASDELINSFVLDSINHHVLCSSKHHMGQKEPLILTLTGYSVGSSYCRRILEKLCISSERIKALTKLIPYIHVQSRLWKFVQLSLKGYHVA